MERLQKRRLIFSRLFKPLWSKALAFLFPAYCLGCGRPLAEPGWCASCREELPRLEISCPLCAEPLGPEAHLCKTCLKETPPFQRVYTPFRYQGLWAEALKGLKYDGRLWLVRALAGEWLCALREPLPAFDAVVPVPLHVKRLQSRGFNQSLLLAREIFQKERVRNWLVRPRETTPQVRLSGQERQRNVRGAFALAPGVSIRGLKILLFDDVMTTGATARECAKVLLKAGALEVCVAVLARAGYNL